MRWLVIAIVAAACGEDPIPIPPECNGSVELCDRRYNEVAYATTHNAMSNAQDGWQNPNQDFNIKHQLDDGVRALMLDAHEYGDGVLLCHVFCQLGSLPLADGLRIIRDFLHSHRGEVVTIIFESYVTPEEMQTAFKQSGLDHYVHAQVAGEPWPTLRELIDADERMIVFTDDGGGTYPWYMDVWAHAYETNYQAATIDEFTCNPNRGTPGNPLFIFNHFLTNVLAEPDQAPIVNANPFLLDRARMCQQIDGSLPNFVTVDFYDQGNLFDAVHALNGLP
ncbi:MAG TPA: hypothetical protein VLB44_26845 [Kofleriaceae bacterium]|nr:hypothetical protein [Kofleriaceae bacterium]